MMLVGQQVFGQSRRADGGSRDAEPAQPTLQAYQDIDSPPKTRAKARNGTPNPPGSSGPSTSAVRAVM